jgi:hypothetical protein
MNAESIINDLLSDGWREQPSHYRDGTRLFYKSFADAHECKCNQGKRKQLEIYYYLQQRISRFDIPDRFQIECHGKLPNNEWIRMSFRGFDSIDKIDSAAKTLIDLWNHTVSITPNVEEPD